MICKYAFGETEARLYVCWIGTHGEYKKGLSKETIRILSERFKLTQDAFNRPYELHVPVNPKFKDAKMMNNRKKLEKAS